LEVLPDLILQLVDTCE
jgi:hypothetical protein